VGHREGVEIIILLLIGRVGPRFSRVRVLSDSSEVMVLAPLSNKSTLAHPRPIGVLLQCQW
jgi:hypothetical protein